MSRLSRAFFLFVLFVTGAFSRVYATNENSSAWTFKTGYESHYVTEGRDNLNGNPLWTASAEFSSSPITIGFWYGHSPAADYAELNLAAAWSAQAGPVDVTCGFTWLRFLEDGTKDAELSLTLEKDGLPGGLASAVSAVYSAEARGLFCEAILAREFRLGPGDVTLSPFVAAGWNEGYVADGHRGMNHVAFGLSGAAPLGKLLRLTAHVACSCAVDAEPASYPGDGALGDILHAGVAVEMAF